MTPEANTYTKDWPGHPFSCFQAISQESAKNSVENENLELNLLSDI